MLGWVKMWHIEFFFSFGVSQHKQLIFLVFLFFANGPWQKFAPTMPKAGSAVRCWSWTAESGLVGGASEMGRTGLSSGGFKWDRSEPRWALKLLRVGFWPRQELDQACSSSGLGRASWIGTDLGIQQAWVLIVGQEQRKARRIGLASASNCFLQKCQFCFSCISLPLLSFIPKYHFLQNKI